MKVTYVKATVLVKVEDAEGAHATLLASKKLSDIPGIEDVFHTGIYRVEEVDEDDDYKRKWSFDYGVSDKDDFEEEIRDEATGEIKVHAFPVPPSSYPEDSPRHERYRQFIREMKDAGIACCHYSGRMFYEGPAVRCRPNRWDDDDSTQPIESDVRNATRLELKHDSMGLGSILYPE